jgi:hypothetical protein
MIDFNTSEKIDILKSIGYEIEEIDTWDIVSVYHNDVETTYHKLTIAYPIGFRPSEDHLDKVHHTVKGNFGIDAVFNDYLKFSMKHILKHLSLACMDVCHFLYKIAKCNWLVGVGINADGNILVMSNDKTKHNETHYFINYPIEIQYTGDFKLQ